MSKEKLTTLDNLTYFLSWLNRKFSALDHTHTAEEIGITVDASLSSTSSNPVENKAVYESIDALSSGVAYIDLEDDSVVSVIDLLPTAEGVGF